MTAPAPGSHAAGRSPRSPGGRCYLHSTRWGVPSGFSNQLGPGTQTIYGADFIYTAGPGRPVEGVVRDAKTGAPREGVTVVSERFAGSDYGEIRTLKDITDREGSYRLVGFARGSGNRLVAVPGEDRPYFQRVVPVGDPPGIGAVVVDVELHRGIWITGKVTDKASGEPVTATTGGGRGPLSGTARSVPPAGPAPRSSGDGLPRR